MKICRFIVLALLSSTLPSLTFAAEPAVQETAAPGPTPALNPYMAKVESKAKELAKSMTTPEVQALTVLRTSFGMVRSVALVKKNVEEAVQKCVKANPAMKQDMYQRFGQWSGRVTEPLDAQQEKLKKSISKEWFSQPEEVDAYLGLLDKAAEHAEGQVDAEVVTTPEACGGLLKSLDETESTLVTLLQEIKWPGEVNLDRAAPVIKPPEAGNQ